MRDTRTRSLLLNLAALFVVATALIIASGPILLAHGAEGTTTISFSANPATLVSGPDVILTTHTTSAGHPEKVDDGKIHIFIATDGSGKPVACTEVVEWVRIDAAVTGGGGGQTVTAGETTLSLDLENLSSLALDPVLNDVACGDTVCFRAQYVTGGGQHKVNTHYSDPANLMTACDSQGCTPGYWKNHTSSWAPAAYSPSQPVASVFSQASSYPAGSATMHQALYFGGGPGVDGAVEILLRAAVAAVLNASHPDVSYSLTPISVVTAVNAALASGSRDQMLNLAATLDFENNLGCPLN